MSTPISIARAFHVVQFHGERVDYHNTMVGREVWYLTLSDCWSLDSSRARIFDSAHDAQSHIRETSLVDATARRAETFTHSKVA